MVIRCGVLGFCMGVRRAVALAASEADRANVYTLGPLIHNPVVLADLKARGVQEYSQDIHPLNNCTLIIRAHGIDPRLEDDLRAKGARIVDATCPRVKESQLKAQSLSRAGYRLFLAGEAQHAEIAGILGYACVTSYVCKTSNAGFCPVVSNAVEAEVAAKSLYETDKEAKTALIAQTTMSEEEYHSIGEAIKKYFPDLEIVQTICTATRDRQQALRELLDQVDAVIIAGGKGSANTRRLLAIAEESGKPCVLAETAAEIPPAFRDYAAVGLAAGASTPDSVIDEIEKELQTWDY
jgi:4-hydroxy-3-methylbut-2-enyl diphosphate reductase